MLDFAQKGKVVITFKDRFSPFVEKELKDLGFKPKNVFRTYIELYASLNECMYLNMHLRVASHVLFEIKSFYLHHADDIYRRVKTLPWEEYITKDTYFSVNSHVENDSVDNPLFVNVRVKDAIVDRFRENTGVRPDTGSAYDGAVFQLFWKETQATLYINTSGETIAKHGYRKIPGKAPMLEALAAATIYATGWDRKSPFVNPMCGSGTLAIEAALIATNRFPGLYRDHYSFMHIIGYEESAYLKMKAELEEKITPIDGIEIIASDIVEQAVLFTKENAATAGVEDLISYEVCDFEETTIPDSETGIMMVNPEYGERLGEEAELEATYKRLGDFMKQRCAGYTGFVFTGNLDLAKRVGLRPSRKMEFYNGTIDCRLLKYELYKGKKDA
ncbi:putative N6-adenine-specific DNA methylase [Belliella baltica DSM 15883]|uniref:Putative N6-adenine-specific DNA methylase n=1 Tax=Belliella baltica (strain DSM 15883 / CIP 108006 / LMG 21964 / BA134) TaxID=866536 RepID=I3Z7D3_BELBD|nr:THUMP domain-containing protein [Belliella baltica]AFL85151.1 putative N6-adenine-specific DNA methylase [Belliella baltica DSM 15883]